MSGAAPGSRKHLVILCCWMPGHKLDIQLSQQLSQRTTFTSLCLGFCADIREKQCHCYLAAPPHSSVGLTHSWYLANLAAPSGRPPLSLGDIFCRFLLLDRHLNSLWIFHRNFSPSCWISVVQAAQSSVSTLPAAGTACGRSPWHSAGTG